MTKLEQLLEWMDDAEYAPSYGELRKKVKELIAEEQQVNSVDLADVGEPLPTDFADWIADQDLYKYGNGWGFEGVNLDTDELYSEFLKSYSKWKANR